MGIGKAAGAGAAVVTATLFAMMTYACSVAPTDKVIISGPVTLDKPNGSIISGTFELREAPSGEDGLSSHGTGGACLIADLTRFGIPEHATCQAHSECQPDQTKYPHWYGYCAENRCWVRPGPDGLSQGVGLTGLCNRSLEHNGDPWSVGPHVVPIESIGNVDTTPLTTVLNVPKGTIIDWRVHSCLNGRDLFVAGKDNAWCGAAKKPWDVGREHNSDPVPVKL